MAPIVWLANSTLAMGIPLARLFCEPQNTIVTSSSRVKSKRREAKREVASTKASSIPINTTRPASANIGSRCHSPWLTDALKAVYTTSKIEPWSTNFNTALCLSTHVPIQRRAIWPAMNGSSNCMTIDDTDLSEPPAEVSVAINMPARAGVRKMPIMVEAEALQISVTQLTADYAVVADAAHAKSFEVYSIDSVKMVRRRGQKEAVTEFRPFYSLRHGEDASTKNGHYWMLRSDDELAALSPGHEKRITLIDGDFNPMEVEKTSLSIALSCTNRDLPNALKYGQAGGDLTPLRDADSYSVRLMRRPTRTCRFAKGSQQWRLISHLTVNQHALSRGGLPAFREMLALYDLPHSPISRRQIEGITDLQQAATVTWMRHKHGAALVHGTEMRMTLDEEAFVGSGLLLFVEVIDQFLGLYVQVNSFIELVVISKQSDKELMRCKPRSGYLTLA